MGKGYGKMSKLSEKNFFFGAGIQAIFEHNKNIMPSMIDSVKVEGKITKGIFYRLTGENRRSVLVYLKYTDNVESNFRFLKLWTFSLSGIEKTKVEKNRVVGEPFYLVAICVDRDCLEKSEVILLNESVFDEIKERANIKIGLLRNSEGKTSRPKQVQVRVDKSRWISVSRKYIEQGFEELKKTNHIKNSVIDKEKDLKEAVTSESALETNNKDKYKIRVRITLLDGTKKTNKVCPICNNGLKKHKMKIQTGEGEEKIAIFLCEQCERFFTPKSVYSSFEKRYSIKDERFHFTDLEESIRAIQGDKKATIVEQVHLLPDNITSCPSCKANIYPVSVKLYVGGTQNRGNSEGRIVDEDLFYCKRCEKYYATPINVLTLNRKYGKDMVRYTEEKTW